MLPTEQGKLHRVEHPQYQAAHKGEQEGCGAAADAQNQGDKPCGHIMLHEICISAPAVRMLHSGVGGMHVNVSVCDRAQEGKDWRKEAPAPVMATIEVPVAIVNSPDANGR